MKNNRLYFLLLLLAAAFFATGATVIYDILYVEHSTHKLKQSIVAGDGVSITATGTGTIVATSGGGSADTVVTGTTGTTNVIVNRETIYFATFVHGTTTTLTLPVATLGNLFYVEINGANGTSTLTTSATVYRSGDSVSGTLLTPNQVSAANAKHTIKFWADGTNWWYADTFSAATNLAGTGPGGVTGLTPIANGGTNAASVAAANVTMTPTAVDLGNLTGTININWASGNLFRGVLTGNTTFTFSNAADGRAISVDVGQTGTNVYTVTWPTMKWPGGAAPTMTTGAATNDITTVMDFNAVFKGNSVQNVK